MGEDRMDLVAVMERILHADDPGQLNVRLEEPADLHFLVAERPLIVSVNIGTAAAALCVGTDNSLTGYGVGLLFAEALPIHPVLLFPYALSFRPDCLFPYAPVFLGVLLFPYVLFAPAAILFPYVLFAPAAILFPYVLFTPGAILFLYVLFAPAALLFFPEPLLICLLYIKFSVTHINLNMQAHPPDSGFGRPLIGSSKFSVLSAVMHLSCALSTTVA